MRKAPTASFHSKTVEAQRESGTSVRPHSRSGVALGTDPQVPWPQSQAFPTGCFLQPHPPTSELILRNTHSATCWTPAACLRDHRQWGTQEEPARKPPALNSGGDPPRLHRVPTDGCRGQFCSSIKAAENIPAPRVLCTRGSLFADKFLAQPLALSDSLINIHYVDKFM